MKIKTMYFRWVSCGILGVFILAQVNLAHAEDQERSYTLAPISPLFEGTGVPGYRTNQFTGTATYEIPLKVPAGINGFQPDLTIRYNVNNAEGSILGKGWELSLGRIIRSQRKKPADFTDDDTFILELGGIRDELVKINSSGDYATLYKKRDFKITKFSGYWTVQDGQGTTYRFEVLDQAEGAPGIWGWYLSKITETHGNTINIQYVKKDGWQILDKITYSNREIRFITSATAFNEFWPKFDKVGKAFMRYFLGSIEMYTNGSLHKKYEFTYNNIAGFKNKFLSVVEEVGSDGTKKQVAVMTYEPATDNVQFGAAVPFPDLPQKLGDVFLRIGEVDGDGRPDLMASGYGDPIYYALNNGNGWSSRVLTNVSRPCTTNPCDYGFYQPNVKIADVDGDGLSDAVAQGTGTVSPFGNYFYTAFGKGLGWESWKKSVNTFPYPLAPNNPPGNVFITDINSDGKADILSIHSTADPNVFSVTYAFSDGRNGWRTATTKTISVPNAQRFTSFDGSSNVRLMDINRDGIDDLVFVRFAHGSSGGSIFLIQENAYLLGNGSGFDSQVYSLEFNPFLYLDMVGSPPAQAFSAEYFSFNDKSLNITDLNNDGILDFTTKAQDKFRYMLGTDKGFGDVKDFNPSGVFNSVFSFSNPNVVFLDFNNDGLIDIVDGFNQLYYPNLTATHFSPGILKTITDELGKKTTFKMENSYQTTQSTVPFRFPLLKKIEETDGYSPARSFTYEYFIPKYDRTEHEFDGFGRVREIDAGGRWTDTFYLQDRPRLGFIDKVERSNGSKVTNVYTNNTSLPYDNTLTSDTTEETGKIVTRSFVYDVYGNVTQEIVSANNGDRFTTDRFFDPNVSSWLISFPHQETVIDQNGSKKEVKFRYDGTNTTPTKGDLTQEIRYLDTENKDLLIEYAYDIYGNRISAKDPLGNFTKFKFDSTFNSFPVEVENALNQKETKTYWEDGGGFGQVKTSIDLNGIVTQYFYDGFGRISKIVGPNDHDSFYGSISYRYNVGSPGNNFVETLETKENGTSQFQYRKESKDGFGQIVQTIQDGENGQPILTKNIYDYRGNLLCASLPGFNSPGPDIINSYDLFDRMISTTYPGNHTTGFSYNGWQTTITDANNHWKILIKDSKDRITQVTEDGSFVTTYQYDIFDNLKKITDHFTNVWSYIYDSIGRKISESDPDLGQSSFQYDNNGNLLQKTDALNHSMSYSYDNLNRLIQKDYLNTPGIDYSYFYDEADSTFGIGRRTRMSDPSGETKFYYDNEGRMIKTVTTVIGFNNPFVLQKSYDALDRMTAIIYPNQRQVNFTYNEQGLVETIPEFLNNADYTSLGQTKKLSFPNGIDANYTYKNDDQRLSRIQASSFMDFNYQYDSVGNITQMRDDIKGWAKNYTYDQLNRLLSGDGETFSYNAIGNITSRNGVPQFYNGLQPHTLTSDGVAIYSYDGTGNMFAGAGRAIDYDTENRPISIVLTGTTTQFIYNGDNNRTLKIVSDGLSVTKTVYIDEFYEKEITV